jgi:diguanylate cyclase (GGDEF)-like protein
LTIPNSREPVTTSPAPGQLLSVSDAARLLGVHANTVRTWTDRGVLACRRINERGDRRYSRREIERFLSRNEQARRHNGHAVGGGSTIGLLLAQTADLATRTAEPAAAMSAVASLLCSEGGYGAAAFVGGDGSVRALSGALHVDRRLLRRAASRHRPVVSAVRQDGTYQVALPVAGEDGSGGVLLLAGTPHTRTADEFALLAGVSAQLKVALAFAGQLDQVRQRQQRAELLLSVDSDMSTRLDPSRVLSQLIDRAVQAFGAQHAGVFIRRADGSFRAQVTRNLSTEFCQVIEHAARLPLSSVALDDGRVLAATDYVNDPRALELRPAMLREGINTIAVAPLVSEGAGLGVLALYHDDRHEWPADDLALFERLADHGATIMRSAQNYSQMATWAAQLQSIQQLGARLTRLRNVTEIGQAICAELGHLIDTHNIRVYRIVSDTCMPVAWRGEIGEYETENGEQLKLKIGEGITGWVARHGLAQNVPDAAGDRRAKTIPGTQADLDESLLLAPMLYEDVVIGVIVLAKLGLHQFTADDLRLLEIYASIAAQAMANADVTERLHAQSEALARQVSGQRELLRVTESILATLDTQALLEEIAERLNTIVTVDNISVSLHDQATRQLRTIFARGVHAAQFLQTSISEDDGVSGYVLTTGEAQLVRDELTDPRVVHRNGLGPQAGALIVAPLRGPERVQGVLIIERLGADAHFSDEEFDLVKLFAAHVSIALRNAAAHRAVEIRAETDRLTGLWNHGALTAQVARMVGQPARFGMLMVDLDYFKQYNDAHGHQAGNVMLQRVAQQLRTSCRDSDLVYRFGGDEFVLLLPGTGLAGARTVAEKINSAIATIDGGGQPSGPTCSVGVAAYPKDGRDGPALILAADRACYAAKRSGRNRVAVAADGLALAADFQPTAPTPAEQTEPVYSAA